MEYTWWPEDNLWEIFLSFFHMGSEDGIKVTRLGGKNVCLLLNLIDQVFSALRNYITQQSHHTIFAQGN